VAGQLKNLHAPKKRGRFTSISGFVVFTQFANPGDLPPIIASLAQQRLPVAVVDEIGKEFIPGQVMANPFMRLFAMSISSTPGILVGNYLHALGHRKVAFHGAVVNEEWSRNRYLGLVHSFKEFGIDDGITNYGLDCFEEFKLIVQGVPGTQPIDTVFPLLSRMRACMNPDAVRDAVSMYPLLVGSLWEMRLEALMKPTLEKALANRAITAWVAESDFVALLAQQFLRTKGVRVPDDISLIGFDDSIEALGAGLSSFNFNVPALVHAVMNHIQFSSSSRRLVNTGPLEIEGMVMERQTTGRARAS
jgi:hypothetical protein